MAKGFKTLAIYVDLFPIFRTLTKRFQNCVVEGALINKVAGLVQLIATGLNYQLLNIEDTRGCSEVKKRII